MSQRVFSQSHRHKKPLLLGLLAAAALLVCAFVSALVWPEESAEKLLTGGKLTVDAGNAASGYILVKGPESKKKLKVRVTYEKDVLTYDLNTEGEYEVFPLQSGSGTYTVALYEQASGKKYSQGGKVTVKAKLTDEEGCFLLPNQYVDYDESSPAVQEGLKLAEGLGSEKEIYEAVCAYIKKNYAYDFMRAVTVKSGELPDIANCFETKTGICQDLSALTVCMLRVNGIHARLVIGYADKAYHAWVTANVDGEEMFFDPTLELKALKKVKSYTVERIY